MPYSDKNKQREFQKLWKRKKIDWFWKFKEGLVCSKCGESHPAVLQFHHLRDKEREIGRLVNSNCSQEKIMNEISKCVVLCANCHLLLHYNEQYKNARNYKFLLLSANG